jgi:hypothetical protein
MGKTNIADGDRVPLQVGEILPPGERDRSQRQRPQPVELVDNVNIRAGNAAVGEQTDVHVGDIRI